MKPSPISVVMLVVFLFLAPAMLAQSPTSGNQSAAAPAPSASTADVPRLLKFSGTLLDAQDRPLAGPVGVTFALHSQQTGGAALWMETQNVTPDARGLYTVLLGANSAHGVPAELFASGEARWLEVQVERQAEQPRVLLVSVPYALKAADAETLGGKPLSSFVLATPPSAGGAGASKAPNLAASTTGVGTAAIGGGGNQNFVTKFDVTGMNVVNSQIFDNGTNVGIGTTSPARSLHIRSAAPVIRLEDSTLPNSFWELQQSAFVTDTFGFLRYENGAAVQAKSFVVSSAGNLGIGTATPQRKLHIKSAAPVIRLEDSTLPNSFWELQQSAFFVDTFGFLRYESGVAVPSKSFVMSSAGNFGIGITAPGQKLSVAGVIQSTTGGFKFPDSTVQTTASLGGSVSSVGSGLGLTGGPITSAGTLAINPAVVPQLGASNTFTGSITANSFTGSGAGLSNVNAAMLNGLASTTFATVGANSFTGNQSVAGNVSLTGNLGLPNTTSGTVGVISLGGTPFAHNFGPANAANTFIGVGAGNFSTTGVLNSAFGLGALSANTNGFDNSAFGVDALLTNTTGADNSAFGVNALSSNKTGHHNSAFGSSALDGLTSGNFNIAIGAAAGTNLVGSESNNIYIGNAGVASESNIIRIGNTDILNGPVQTAAFVAGINGATSASGTAVLVNSSGQLGTILSSRRFKDDIADMAGESDLLMKLRPVAFYYKPQYDETHTRQYGLVAEEVAQVSPELVVFDKDGVPQTVRYHFVNAMLLNEVQKQRQLVEEQRRANEEQRSTIARQQAEIQDLAARLAKLEAFVVPVR